MIIADIITGNGQKESVPFLEKDDEEFKLDRTGHVAFHERYYRYGFKVLGVIADILGTEVPYMSIWMSESPIFYEKLQVFGDGQEKDAYSKKEAITLYNSGSDKNKAIIFSSQLLGSRKKWLGTMAHEMYHIYQYEQKKDMKGLRKGMISSINDPLEIEADGFGMWFLSVTMGISLSECRDIMCLESEQFNTKNEERVAKAEEFLQKYGCCPELKEKIGKQPTKFSNYIGYIKGRILKIP